jgi:hypothetical protein
MKTRWALAPAAWALLLSPLAYADDSVSETVERVRAESNAALLAVYVEAAPPNVAVLEQAWQALSDQLHPVTWSDLPWLGFQGLDAAGVAGVAATVRASLEHAAASELLAAQRAGNVSHA